MADKKISALTASTTPLAGTEVLPIVQSGATVKVSVANLTAGRNVGMAGATSTDDLTVSAGKGLAWSGNGNTRISPEDNVQGTLIASGGSLKVTVNGGTNAFNVDGTTANATINAGNLVIGTSGKGIDFSATPGTGTSELLADYEEGTWTPVGNVITLSAASGFYTKVGRLVTFSGNVTFPVTADGNVAFFTGLPFTVNASAAANGNGTIGSSTYALAMTGRVLQGFDRWYNFAIGGGLLTNANLSGVSIEFGGAYIV